MKFSLSLKCCSWPSHMRMRCYELTIKNHKILNIFYNAIVGWYNLLHKVPYLYWNSRDTHFRSALNSRDLISRTLLRTYSGAQLKIRARNWSFSPFLVRMMDGISECTHCHHYVYHKTRCWSEKNHDKFRIPTEEDIIL